MKAIRLLEVLAGSGQGLGLSEVARRSGVPIATAHRVLCALGAEGYVTRDPRSKRYRAGLRVLQLAGMLMDGVEVRRVALPAMRRLMEQSRETVHLIQYEAGEAVYVEKVDCPQEIGLQSRAGKRVPAHTAAAGKVLLAYMPEAERETFLRLPLAASTPRTIVDPAALRLELQRVRERGYALDDRENRADVICVAAPLLDADGAAVAAISVAGPSFRFSLEKAEALAPVVREAALMVSGELGYRYDPRPPVGASARPASQATVVTR